MLKTGLSRISMIAAACALAACSESATAPASVSPARAVIAGLASRAPSLAVSGGPDLSDFHTFEGEVWICKDGNVAGTSFLIDYNVVRKSDNTIVSSGTVSVPLGKCVLATTVSTEVNGRYLATATEQAPPANWSLTAIDWAYGLNFPLTPPPPTIDLAARTISAVLIANDVGVQLTFTNSYTPPPTGEIGDFVWTDVNGNGVQDAGEAGMAGLAVTLGGAANATTTTNVNGAYLFSGLSAGNYVVTVATPAGFAPSPSLTGGNSTKDSNGSPASVTLAANNSIDYTIDFGFVRLPPPPPSGPSCTLTQGFWKNHTELWHTKGERIVTTTDLFFKSGKTYIALMTTPPAGGNSYLQLAHQYIAAKLNLDGGSDPTINGAIAQAESIFNGFGGGVWTSKDKALTALAKTLDNYNNGVTGPGHCN